jgi:hypothetical protein
MTDTHPLTTFIIYLLKNCPTREDAGKEARRLNLRLDWARYYFEVMVR